MQLNLDNAVHYHAGGFPPANLEMAALLPGLLDATDALARFDQMLSSLHNSEVFLAPLRNQEAVVSSRMEGTISTLDEILQLEAELEESDSATPEFRSEAIETLLYQRALRTAQRQMQEGQPLSATLVRSIHQQLLSFGRGASKAPGQFKTEQNYVGQRGSRRVDFVPIAPEQLSPGLDALFTLMFDDNMPALLRAALCHAEFEALHPFKDGNGRVGRMLITLMLWSEDAISAPHFYISRYFEDEKDEYIARLRAVSSHGDWTGWCVFFMQAVAEQARHNLHVASQVRDLYEAMKTRFAEVLSSKWSVNALDYMFTSPVFRNSRFTANAGIPAQSAARFSRMLLEADLLETVQEASGRRSAIYRFEPLLELVRA